MGWVKHWLPGEKKQAQKLFGVVWAHLLAQKKASMRTVGGEKICAYRGARGLKCAIGALIDDEAYSKELEANGVADQGVMLALEASGWKVRGPKFQSLLIDLQVVHDCDQPENWAMRLNEVANDYGLKTPEVK